MFLALSSNNFPKHQLVGNNGSLKIQVFCYITPCRMVTIEVSEGIAASMFKFVQSKKPLTGLAVLPVSSELYRQFTVLP
jgi:hypothetical protein